MLMRIFVPWIVLAAILGFALGGSVVSFAQPTGNQTAQSEKDAPTYSTNEQPDSREVDKSFGELWPVIWKHTWEDPVAFHTFLLMVFTGCLGVATIALTVVAITQLSQSRRELAHTQEIERAYLTGGGPNSLVGPYFFHPEVANYGKTPAVVFAYDIRFTKAGQIDTTKALPVDPERWPYDDRIPPGAYQPHRIGEPIPVVPSDADFIYGAFWYRDIWKDEHIFRFILRIKSRRTWPDVSPKEAHSDYKYWD
jgi:hypothetical protein